MIDLKFGTRKINKKSTLIRVGDIEFDSKHGIVLKGEKRISLTPIAMLVLDILSKNQGSIVSRDQLIIKVWKERDVFADEALTKIIHEIRMRFGDNAHSSKYIETVRGRGYRLLNPNESFIQLNESDWDGTERRVTERRKNWGSPGQKQNQSTIQDRLNDLLRAEWPTERTGEYAIKVMAYTQILNSKRQ